MARTDPTIPLVYITAFLVLFGETVQPAPRLSIYESLVCKTYYASHPSPSPDCKIPRVQSELALLSGIERLSVIIPSILAIPFAFLADRHGHSLILAVAIFGVFLEDAWPWIVTWWPDVFPLRLIWLHFVFSCVGGGFTTVVTLMHVIIADVVGAEGRTRMFFRARAAGVAAGIVGYACSGAMMRVNSYLPWGVGLGSLLLGTVTAGLIPNRTVDQATKPVDADADEVDAGWRAKTRRTSTAVKDVAALLLGSKKVVAMLLLVFVCQLGYDAGPQMLPIFMSKRFGWSFADVQYVLCLCASIHILTSPPG